MKLVTPKLSFPKAIRAHAMMHVAMHDALNAVIPLYRQYAYHGHEPGAHPIAAAAQAAHDVAVSQYPGQQAETGRGACEVAFADSGHAAQDTRNSSRPAERGHHPCLAR